MEQKNERDEMRDDIAHNTLYLFLLINFSISVKTMGVGSKLNLFSGKCMWFSHPKEYSTYIIHQATSA